MCVSSYVAIEIFYPNLSMFLGRFIDLKWFFAAFFVGLLAVYLTAPPHHVVYKFPSPDHPNLVFSNKDGGCYRYDAQKVTCSDFEHVRDQPTIIDEMMHMSPDLM